jgi:hypothetical protein
MQATFLSRARSRAQEARRGGSRKRRHDSRSPARALARRRMLEHTLAAGPVAPEDTDT